MSNTLIKAGLNAAIAAADTVNTHVKTDLNAGQIADIAANMPPPAAMESLWPQLGRQILVAAGGVIVAKGWLNSSDWQLYSGAILVIAPIAWRIGQTYLARRAI